MGPVKKKVADYTAASVTLAGAVNGDFHAAEKRSRAVRPELLAPRHELLPVMKQRSNAPIGITDAPKQCKAPFRSQALG